MTLSTSDLPTPDPERHAAKKKIPHRVSSTTTSSSSDRAQAPADPEVLQRELQRAEAEAPSYAEFLRRILREEFQDQQMRFLEHRLRRARLPERWSLDTFPWKQQPSLKRSSIEQLATLDFVDRAANIVFVGEPGVGKTGIASAILARAREGLPGPLHQGAGPLRRDVQEPRRPLLATLAQATRQSRPPAHRRDGLPQPAPRAIQHLLQAHGGEKYGKKSTIITTNLHYDRWYDFLGNKDLVSARSTASATAATIHIDGATLSHTRLNRGAAVVVRHLRPPVLPPRA
ncbi:MAG: ATP-binding protein [Sandaracinaceae bacterium]|nr:ATP-binding protein [Sandaracinaceae bacterium]